MLVEVEILGCVITAQYGALKQGDILRTDAAFAAHLVNDCGAAKYTQAMEPVPEGEAVEGDGTGEPLPEIVIEETQAEPAPETVTAEPKPKKQKA